MYSYMKVHLDMTYNLVLLGTGEGSKNYKDLID
jgi:hypothetical protein